MTRVIINKGVLGQSANRRGDDDRAEKASPSPQGNRGAKDRSSPQDNRSAKDNHKTTWLSSLSPLLRQKLSFSKGSELSRLEEIRLRVNRPLLLRFADKELTIDKADQLSSRLQDGYLVSRADLDRNLEVLSKGSLYAWEDEFKNGYLTVPGGHRVGFVGRAVLDKGMIRTLKEISGFNYRISREFLGCADETLPLLINKGQVLHTLIISPPQCGKTTLLRDMVRQLSEGVPGLGFPGVNVGLVDERSELAGTFEGQPQFLVGLRTDVLDACPKAQGMVMLIRSMSPRVVATDEIGKPEDVKALHEALQAGVSVLTTIHGGSIEEVAGRPYLRKLFSGRFFERIILLSRRNGPGTIEAVYEGKTLERTS